MNFQKLISSLNHFYSNGFRTIVAPYFEMLVDDPQRLENWMHALASMPQPDLTYAPGIMYMTWSDQDYRYLASFGDRLDDCPYP